MGLGNTRILIDFAQKSLRTLVWVCEKNYLHTSLYHVWYFVSLIEVQGFRKISDRFRGIYGMYFKSLKINC